MKNILFLLIIIHSIAGFSQFQTECEKILSQEIELDFTKKSEIEILNNTFSKLQDCGLEKIDIQLFSKGPILATMIIQLINDNKGKVTYQNLFDKLIEFKKTPKYAETIAHLKVFNELLERKADIKNWENDIKLFRQLPIPEDIIDKIYIYLQANSKSNKTYSDLFKYLQEIETSQKKEIVIGKKEYNGIFKNFGNVKYDDLLKKARVLKKPLLLYFTGYACINSRKMEESILDQNQITEKLKNNYFFVNLYVDDRTLLPKNEWTESKVNGKTIKYVGQKNIDLQILKFKRDYQPYFVIIDNKGIKISEQNYTQDIKEFEEFLNTIEK